MPSTARSYSILTASLVLALLCGPAAADHAESWYLLKVLSGFDSPNNTGGVTYEVVRADGAGGEIRVRLKCRHSQRHDVVYLYTWKFAEDISRIRPGQRILVQASARREDTLGAQCRPGEWTPCLGLDQGVAASRTALVQGVLSDIGDALTTWKAFNTRHRGRIYPEDVGHGEPTTGEAELRVYANAACNAAVQFRIETGASPISVVYVFKALEQGEEPPVEAGPGGRVPGERVQIPAGETSEPFARARRTTLQVGQRRVKPGEIVSLPVYIVNARGLSNMDFEVQFDPSVLEPAGEVAQGPMIEGYIFAANVSRGTEPVVRVAFASTDGISGSGPIAAIPFRVIGRPGAVGGVAVAVTQANEPSGAVPTVDVIFGGVLVLDESGGMKGDGNGDGCVDELDARIALRMTVGQRAQNPLLDMDGDGKVSSFDAMQILQYASGRR